MYFLTNLSDRIVTMSQGMLDLRVWPKQEADGSFPSSTPGKARDHGREQMQRLAKVHFSLQCSVLTLQFSMLWYGFYSGKVCGLITVSIWWMYI